MTPCPKLALLALASLALVSTACQLPPFLPEFEVSVSASGDDLASDVAMGEEGDFVVVWGESAPEIEVVGRRFDADTSPLAEPFPMGVDTAIDRTDGSIARDAEGRFVIVWTEDDEEIWGQRFHSDGALLGESFRINTSTPSTAGGAHVASDASGNFVVTWGSTTGTDYFDAKARRYDSNGSPLGDEFTVNVYTTGGQSPSGIAMSPLGFVITWSGQGEDDVAGSFGRRFDETGVPITGDLKFSPDADVEDHVNPDVGMSDAGDFIVVWSKVALTATAAVLGRRYDSAGAPLGDSFPISGTSLAAYDPKVVSDSAGNFVVTWYTLPVLLGEGGGGTNDNAGIRARVYDLSGADVSPEFVVNEITTGIQFRSRPALADDGSFVVAWSSGSVDYDVKGRKSGVRAAPEIVMDPGKAPTIGTPDGGSSFGNGVFEPGETQLLQTAWVNDTAADVLSVAGSSPLFTGPVGADYTINDNLALYDTISAGQTKSCAPSGDCYSVTVSDPAVRPEGHWDALFQETLNLSLPHTWVIHLGETFADVPPGSQFYIFIETLIHNGVTGGCVGGYCPGNPVTRAQMAVFLLKSKFGSAHIPPPCTGTVYTDVPCTGGAFDPWIEELADLGITGGCGGGLYCPNNTVTRQQMAVFLLKAFEGSTYIPPACTQVFDDVPCTPGTGFSDWIEELYDRNITGGCSVTPLLYCPTNPNNRGQMAVFLTKTFGLVLYGG